MGVTACGRFPIPRPLTVWGQRFLVDFGIHYHLLILGWLRRLPADGHMYGFRFPVFVAAYWGDANILRRQLAAFPGSTIPLSAIRPTALAMAFYCSRSSLLEISISRPHGPMFIDIAFKLHLFKPAPPRCYKAEQHMALPHPTSNFSSILLQ